MKISSFTHRIRRKLADMLTPDEGTPTVADQVVLSSPAQPSEAPCPRPPLPSIPVKQATTLAAQAYTRTGMFYPKINNNGVDEVPDVIDAMRRAYPQDETAQILMDMTAGSRALAGPAFGALHEGVSENDRLITGLAMASCWSPNSDTSPFPDPIENYPTEAVYGLLNRVADQTGDEELRSSLERDPEALLTISRAILKSHDLRPGVVLGRAMVPLTEGVKTAMEGVADPQRRGEILGGHYCFLRGTVDGLSKKSYVGLFKSHYIQDVARREEIWPKVKAEYDFELPTLTTVDRSQVDYKVDSALRFGRYLRGADAVGPLVGGPLGLLFTMERGLRNVGSVTQLARGSDDTKGNQAMAQAALEETWRYADAGPVETLSNAAIRLKILIEEESQSPANQSTAYTQRSTVILNKVGEQELTESQKVMLEGSRDAVDKTAAFAYLASGIQESPRDAALKGALYAARGFGKAEHFFSKCADLTDNPLEGSLLAMSTEQGLSHHRQAAIAGCLIHAQKMEPEVAQKFLRRVGLQFIANPQADEPNTEANWTFLQREFGQSGIGLEEAQKVARDLIKKDVDYNLDFLAQVEEAENSAGLAIDPLYLKHRELSKGMTRQPLAGDWGVARVEWGIFTPEERKDLLASYFAR